MNLAEILNPYNYVVQRNWETLPVLDPQHPDLDLFVCEEQANDLKLLLKEFAWIDVRSPSDNYYPDDIARILLVGRRMYNGFWIPSEKAHFLSLYYHNAVHKQNNPYGEKLRKIFLQVYPPVKCIDEGVGFYGDY